jgi:hypothetical protein
MRYATILSSMACHRAETHKAGRVASSTSFERTRKNGFDVIQQKLVRDRTLPSAGTTRDEAQHPEQSLVAATPR